MTTTPDDGLRSALRCLRVPEAPDPTALLTTALLTMALPDQRARKGRKALPWLSLAALVLATLPLWAPSPRGSEAWTDGLARRSEVFANGILDRLREEGP